MSSQGTCPDCGSTYYDMTLDDHQLVCDAHVCDLCLHAYSQVIPLNQYEERVCYKCLDEDNEFHSGQEDREEGDE